MAEVFTFQQAIHTLSTHFALSVVHPEDQVIVGSEITLLEAPILHCKSLLLIAMMPAIYHLIDYLLGLKRVEVQVSEIRLDSSSFPS